ncbi:16S rRNA (guanine(966)-N(2))-methyltransferase RsmD [Helicobacter bizzozeronii]|uniref:16S rRNA (guanine(966)-N(2))-methyltransferase RsmD n=1 Tax=Helicobacter bizzozeronii TaxID=56877 RepID=UPI000CF173E6|nr:16S rRNA (guanine(966)-N(2))-methyltransferase RsmD [Helicobacter bizzozeronii]
MPTPLFKILGGSLKGLSLHLPPKTTTRPTKAIIKQSVFNVLGASIHKSSFVEVFGGSASMGLEALSLGAHQALFFEKDPLVFKVLQQNIQLCQARLNPCNAQSYLGDAFQLLPIHLANLAPQGLLILYFDPPFKPNLYPACWELLEKLDLTRALEHGVLIILEHQSNEHMGTNPPSFSIIKQRKFGKTSLSYYILKGK